MSEAETKQPEHRFSNRKEVREEVLALAAKPEDFPPVPLALKIKAIQDNVGDVKKKGKHAQGWAYLQIEDAVRAVNKLISAQGLILTGTLAKKPSGEFDIARANHHDKGYITDLVMVWTLKDVLTGEKESFDIPGSGFDSTDKGTYKAQTGSRKYAIIQIFNLPVGDNPEASTPSREDAKASAKAVGERKVTELAAMGNKGALDALSQIEPEKKILIGRPDEHNGNYIIVTGFIAAPPLERFFDDTASKRFKTAKDAVPYWRVPSEYEKGLIELCKRLGIEVEG